jgi:hypothetical protein
LDFGGGEFKVREESGGLGRDGVLGSGSTGVGFSRIGRKVESTAKVGKNAMDSQPLASEKAPGKSQKPSIAEVVIILHGRMAGDEVSPGGPGKEWLARPLLLEVEEAKGRDYMHFERWTALISQHFLGSLLGSGAGLSARQSRG